MSGLAWWWELWLRVKVKAKVKGVVRPTRTTKNERRRGARATQTTTTTEAAAMRSGARRVAEEVLTPLRTVVGNNAR